MFTGIVQGLGKLVGKQASGGGLAFELKADFELSDPEEGESIAINGVCLTAYDIRGNLFKVDVSPESLSRTTLGDLGVGALVNMERALQLSDRLGGHLVSGHVDCVATVHEKKTVGEYTVFTFLLPAEFDRYIIEKGSVSIDGVSLTVNSCGVGRFTVSIIPHTLRVTTFGGLHKGSRVNIELDIIGKYVEKLLLSKSDESGQRQDSEINPAFLAKHGFLK